MKPDLIFTIFMIVWAILGISFFLIFHLNKKVSFKRRYHPVAVILAGVVFAGFITLTAPAYGILLVAYPAIALITYLNIRMTKFCPRCGATNYNRMLFTAMNYCQKCGEPFAQGNGPANNSLHTDAAAPRR